MGSPDLFQWIVLGSLAIYFIFEWWERRIIKDEREELVRLKTFEWVHKSTLVTLTLTTLSYVLWPGMNALVPIFAFVVCSLYVEMVARIVLRRIL